MTGDVTVNISELIVIQDKLQEVSAKLEQYELIRPEIMALAQAIENNMLQHDEERGDDWRKEGMSFYQSRLDGEVAEFHAAIKARELVAAAKEIADVGAFCAMVLYDLMDD